MTMKKLRSIVLLLLLSVSTLVWAQTNSTPPLSMQYLENSFPKLTKLYNSELSNAHTHYIFAIDVSGSMVKYDETVTPALQAFAQALPEGEQVSIIPFGTDAKENTPGLCTTIQGDGQRKVLTDALSTLYKNSGYTPEFRHYTDIQKAVEAVSKAILNNQNVQMNVVVIITDFLNDLPKGGEQKLTKECLQKLNKDFDNATDNTYTRVVAMQLPKAGTGEGYCLAQLQENVFQNASITRKFDIVPVIQNTAAISHWFEQLSREIMVEKLKAVIQLDNARNLHPVLKTKMTIDGKTTAQIRWTPNKLYRQIKIDSTHTDMGSAFVFKTNEDVWQTTQDTALLDLELGKLVHQKWGVLKIDETRNLGISLPTEYDAELKKLSIDKPIPATADNQIGWLFTFFLPFWLTVVLAIAILLYIISVIKAIIRNNSERFIGTVEFSDSKGRPIGDTVRVKMNPSQTLLIGGNGTSNCNLSGASWTVKVVKKKPSPFLFWKRPYFEWSKKDGYVCLGNNKYRGKLGRYGKRDAHEKVIFKCVSASDQITHGIAIKIKKITH